MKKWTYLVLFLGLLTTSLSTFADDTNEFETESSEIAPSKDPLELLDSGQEVEVEKPALLPEAPEPIITQTPPAPSPSIEPPAATTEPTAVAPPAPATIAPPAPEVTAVPPEPLEKSTPQFMTAPVEQAMTAPVQIPIKKSLPKKSAPLIESAAADISGEPTSEEKNLYQVYQSYNSAPTSSEAWNKMIGEKKAEVYVVQRGDTLWDISRTLFADPFFWPKIWALNSKSILNPHEIEPNMKILFFPGSPDYSPNMGLDTDEPTQVLTTAPKKNRVPVLENIPQSIPNYRYGKMVEETEVLTLDLPKTEFVPANEYLIYYVSEAPVTGVGKVTETEMGMGSASEFQYVFVKFNEPQNGKSFYVVKENNKIKSSSEKKSAWSVEVQGELELVNQVNVSENIYRALVKKTLQPIEVGSVLVSGSLPKVDTKPGDVSSTVSAHIIGGQYGGNNRNLIDSHNFIFLDAGSSQGLQLGMNLPVYSDLRMRNRGTKAFDNDPKIGLVKVVHLSEQFSTAYIINSKDDIRSGDYVGSAPILNKEDAAASSDPDGSVDMSEL
ncbi:MAG: LysM peptidoglycan-binding domain-containing protein [Pseudobdellovibrionaceae bacterium]